MPDTLAPAPPLDAFVDRLWDWDAPAPAHRLERILPSPQAQLIINLAEDHTRVYDDALACRRMPACVLDAPAHRSCVIDTAEQVRVMGVVFRSGGAAAFFRERMDRVANSHVELDALAPGGAALRERLLHAPDARARLRLLHDWMRAIAVARPAPRPLCGQALRLLEHAPPVADLDGIAARLGTSPRRFREWFRQDVGLSPKRYLRLQRFRRIAGHAHAAARVDWAALAADCGLHDQAHLVREFRDFSGMTPGQYLACKGEWPSHVPLPALDESGRNLQDGATAPA